MEKPKSQARIAVCEPKWHGQCCLCWWDEQGDDIVTIEFWSPIGQGIITLSLCRAHRAQLKEAL